MKGLGALDNEIIVKRGVIMAHRPPLILMTCLLCAHPSSPRTATPLPEKRRFNRLL